MPAWWPAPRGRNPFDQTGVERGADGIARYIDRPASLVHLLRASVERDRDRRRAGRGRRAVAHLRRAVGARRARRRRPARRRHRARRPRRDPPAQRDRLGARVLRRAAARRGRRAGQHALHRGRGRLRGRRLGRRVHLLARRAAARRRAAGRRGPRARRPGGDLLHERHHRLPQGRDDLARQLHDQQRERLPLPVRRPLRGAGDLHARVGAAVPRHRLQQPADPAARARAAAWRSSRARSTSTASFEAVGAHGVNQLVSVPAIYHAVMRHPKFAELDVSGVRWVSYGGAPIAESLVHQIMDAFPNARVGNGFGLTETSSLTSFLPHEEAAEHADSVGFAMPVVDLAVDEPDPETGRRRAARARPERRAGLLEQARGDRRDVRRRLAAHRRPGAHRRRRPALHRRSQEGHDQPRRRERLLDRGRERARGGARASARRRPSACPTR